METLDDKARFVENLLTLFSQGETGESALTVVDILRNRFRGIWDHLRNDKELFENSQSAQCVRNVIKLSLELSQKLSKKSKGSCEWFLQDLSTSLFFTTVLPKFIQSHANELKGSDDMKTLTSLVALAMHFSPHTATQIWDVAEQLAAVMHTKSIEENSAERNSECDGVQYLIHLGKILSKSVSGYQDVDITNCRWNELPTIPTEKEIFSTFNLNSLDAIKKYERYEKVDQYLDINYRLLREECFRDLCIGIQNFCEDESDAQNMKMYRIKLEAINARSKDTQMSLVLNCVDYYKQEKDRNVFNSEEQEDTSNEILILYGSLMCISLNKTFDSLIWATVVECEQLSDSNIISVSVNLCSDRNKIKNIDVLLQLATITNKGDYALMAESPTFYNAFGPCMDRLKETHKNGDMPLVDELVFVKKSHPPKYTNEKGQKCDWGIIFDKPSECEFTFPKDQELTPIEQFQYLQENVEKSKRLLDETQMAGIENFLKNRVSLIQGPPGTGKSFLGAKILRLMLSMEIHKRFDGPILIMTYKNFALDHFLEACLEYTPNIVRIGQGGSKRLSEINLRNVRHERGISSQFHDMDRNATEKMRTAKKKLKALFKCLKSKTFTIQLLLKAASEFHLRSLLTMSESSGDNIDEARADELLLQWKRKVVPEELKEYLKRSLKRWLPKSKMQERYQPHQTETKSYHHKTKRRSPSSKEPDDNEEDSIDKKDLDKNRKQDAVEEDDISESDDDISNTTSPSGNWDDDEPLTDDLKIPFFYNYSNEIDPKDEFEERLNLWTLSDEKRVEFICALHCKIVREFSKAVTLYEDNAKIHKNISDDHTVSLLKEYDVIGMTVSGAATRLHLLDELKPSAVIVEEAAEIIEGQLVSVLPPSIQHLVMLGDQEQLKPRINCYQLKKKHLDCSMFERLINNNMNFTQLGKQCRMRDDIADLLRELKIYKDLQTNHEKTCDNEPPVCIGSSLYFVKHTEQESTMKGSNSLYNPKEIHKILDVAEKLMKSGYHPSDVTVLCPYRGQVNMMTAAFDRKSKDPREEYLTKLKDINITTVDSFQGEENKVILLSLVRSNRGQKIGFFAVRNRICVAISRAKCGLYIFGNSSVYQTSPNWKKIIDLLTKKNLVGSFIPFKEDATEITTSTTEEDEEPVTDNTKFTERELTRFSTRIVGKWEEIAGLYVELDKGEVDNVRRLDNIQYPEPKDKAKKILSMINDLPIFSRRKLADFLKEVGLHDRMEEVLNGTLRSISGEP